MINVDGAVYHSVPVFILFYINFFYGRVLTSFRGVFRTKSYRLFP